VSTYNLKSKSCQRSTGGGENAGVAKKNLSTVIDDGESSCSWKPNALPKSLLLANKEGGPVEVIQ
jgi:hypothetical protein